MTAILFIDANQYVRLYGINASAKPLAFLEEQKSHIFVTAQIADEVARRKLEAAAEFSGDKLKEIDATIAPVPDRLLSIAEKETSRLRGTFESARAAKTELSRLAGDALERISKSEEDVSKSLSTMFAFAVSPNEEEIERARKRKERGNPPGKARDPLGDQITWEQLLSYCQAHKAAAYASSVRILTTSRASGDAPF